ncbi:hypothetical protein acsn021_21050 [Anaerocolumna cellulosilytica]|uniref:Uncharacterized protein n=1 Tax=Anaerocolumna cellulosilytica TaxID=433286 RepID=A0A6S6QXT5_9FIRM|nr:hypothetical protein [Anaerocolumna cellulosilytica]MBB5194251.1 hypothetical protein [Anaerocolumna cellulosilytica]BCJ94536.1 hypothetical protein acsn021_21050 [Anaerocolumna cellulosilytica]
MIYTSPSAMSDNVQSDCNLIKDIILKLCNNTLLTNSKVAVGIEYHNREILMTVTKEGKEVKGTIPFEILYFDIKKMHVEADNYEAAVASTICEEAERLIAA